MEWNLYAFCPECDYLLERPSFGNTWFTANHYPVCPGCGCQLTKHSIVTKVAKLVFLGKWYLPWTWLRFKLVYRNNDESIC